MIICWNARATLLKKRLLIQTTILSDPNILLWNYYVHFKYYKNREKKMLIPLSIYLLALFYITALILHAIFSSLMLALIQDARRISVIVTPKL